MYPLRLLLDIVPELLVELRALSRSRCASAILSLAGRQPRREYRRTVGQSRGPVPALSLPHDYELRERLSERLEPREGDWRDQADAGEAQRLVERMSDH